MKTKNQIKKLSLDKINVVKLNNTAQFIIGKGCPLAVTLTICGPDCNDITKTRPVTGNDD
ncbi:hypothetical protein [Aquimarina sp. AU474]|uniref:hypothetical protein n=1 Tax=Aquimarina sp. AU474 TaxID=2108529 RepID=UPI000D69E6BC|nr:hypothetical protein [Aquimarina sp. AU474]